MKAHRLAFVPVLLLALAVSSPASASEDDLQLTPDVLTVPFFAGDLSLSLMSADSDTNPYSALFPHVHPLVIGAVDRSSSLSVKLCTEILGFHLDDAAKAEQISVNLNSSYPAHSYPILQHEARRIGLNVADLDAELNGLLLDLHELYSEMGQEAVTYYDEQNSHNNEIVNIIESSGVQVHYQIDQDWHYRAEERRWVTMDDSSSWRKVEQIGEETVRSVFHVR